MRRRETIGFRLAAAFALLLVMLIGFGLGGLTRVDAFNKESEAVRERWLKSTRFLGDLNNYTSDFRALEATFLVATTPTDLEALLQETKTLDDAVVRAEQGYESVAHDVSEMRLYSQFREAWRRYRAKAEPIVSPSLTENRPGAPTVSIYFDDSKPAFAVVSTLLERLSDLTNVNAQNASQRAAETISSAWNYMSAAVLSSVVMVGIILLYVTRIVIFPLKHLASCMISLSKGDMDIQIPAIGERNELGEMARSVSVFRNNAVELKVSQGGLALQATMLEEKLAHEMRLNEQQRNFISMASHEFRTPMTIIDGHAQRLLNSREYASPEKTLERAKKIRTAIRRMSIMIDNILKSVKFAEEGANLYLHRSEFDLRALLHEACKLHREISPNYAVVENIGTQGLIIEGDKNLLFQLFNNLVANAIKYSPGGSAIHVDCLALDDCCVVSVKDQGIGIAAKDLTHIFERYYRGRNVSSIVGTGIGLFFVKVVTDLHGGAIAVDSMEDAGSTFTVRLPRLRARTEAAADA
jgi:signal transduction histidine kinase